MTVIDIGETPCRERNDKRNVSLDERREPSDLRDIS